MKIIPTPQYSYFKLSDSAKCPKDRINYVYSDENFKESAKKALDFLGDFEYTAETDGAASLF